MVKQEGKMTHSSSSSKKKFKGVRMRTWGSWVSEIRAPNQKTRIWLGSYSTAEAAARAYDAALLCLKGSKANLNFPKSIPNFNFPDHTAAPMSPKSIQKIAAAAAAETSTGDLSPPSPLSSSSSSELSSSLSPELSSSSNAGEVRIEDDLISLAAAVCGGGGDGGGGGDCDYSWYNFDSPKYYYEMVNDGVFFDPTMVVEDGEDADIRLWSFC